MTARRVSSSAEQEADEGDHAVFGGWGDGLGLSGFVGHFVAEHFDALLELIEWHFAVKDERPADVIDRDIGDTGELADAVGDGTGAVEAVHPVDFVFLLCSHWLGLF